MNELITVDPRICSDKPVLGGTRIRVKNILGRVARGSNLDKRWSPILN